MARYEPLSVSAEWLINGYKSIISPLQGQNICNFHPTCSQFAKAAIRSQGFLPGVVMAADRLMRCNAFAWVYFDAYYRGDVIGGRIPDPVEGHVARRCLTDEPGLGVYAQSPGGPSRPPPGSYRDAPSLSFAEFLYATGEYTQAAVEFLRVRFASSPSGISDYAGLMAGESYLRAGDMAGARRAFASPGLASASDFSYYGTARTYFAEARYAKTRTQLDSVSSNLLSTPAKVLGAWTYFRQHRFADGAAALGEGGDVTAIQRLRSLDGRGLKRRSRLAGTLLSAVMPGAGQLYSGRAGDGAYSFLTVVGTGLVTWWFAADPASRDRTRVE
ncbi:membrane protein insertion efficiency factor YidD, partial [candidate division WOR-3 bacterium]|nr:membrane protein insertion efficiency factor YidD [candidate division WOR-3 bacterium]